MEEVLLILGVILISLIFHGLSRFFRKKCQICDGYMKTETIINSHGMNEYPTTYCPKCNPNHIYECIELERTSQRDLNKLSQ